MDESNYWTRWNRRRVSRRALLSGSATAALGGAAALVVGCGGGNGNGNGNGEPGASRAPQEYGTPVQGGSITQGRLLNALGIDPHIDLTALDIDARIYSYLYSWQPFGEKAIFNNYAESVEMPAPDATEFIFKLRPGVKIQSQTTTRRRGKN